MCLIIRRPGTRPRRCRKGYGCLPQQHRRDNGDAGNYIQQDTQLPNWSVDDWYHVPFPDWGKLTARQVKALAATYDELSGNELQELRSMLTCDTRKQLDEAVAKALGIPWEAMEKTRIALASEPAITGKTFTGDALVGDCNRLESRNRAGG